MSRTAFILPVLALAACGSADRASVLIAPPLRSPDGWHVIGKEDFGVRGAFDQFTRSHGYRCHSAFNTVGRRVCRGPQDLHMTFEPRLNGTGYVAAFSWVRGDGRTTDEFRQLVQAFSQSIAATGAAVDVRMGQFGE